MPLFSSVDILMFLSFFKIFLQKQYQSFKMFVSRSGPDLGPICLHRSFKSYGPY